MWLGVEEVDMHYAVVRWVGMGACGACVGHVRNMCGGHCGGMWGGCGGHCGGCGGHCGGTYSLSQYCVSLQSFLKVMWISKVIREVSALAVTDFNLDPALAQSWEEVKGQCHTRTHIVHVCMHVTHQVVHGYIELREIAHSLSEINMAAIIHMMYVRSSTLSHTHNYIATPLALYKYSLHKHWS